MKKLFTLFLLFSIGTFLGAQQQDTRTVLIEQFTQASCPPCAPANIYIQNLLKNYTEDEVVILRYQASFPGFDPMYNQNPKDVNAKQSFYSIRSVPGSVIDGTKGPDHPNNILNTRNLNAARKIPPLCRLECTPTTSKDGESIEVHCKVTALIDFVGKEAATIAIIEKHISFDAPPGSNGEKDFFNVMKKLLPSNQGEALPKLKKGESYEFDVSWKLKNIYSIPEVAMIAFVQNTANKKVYQALHIPRIIQSKYANDAQLIWVSIDNGEEDNTTCNTYANPVVEISNRGHDLLTSAIIEYSVNNSASQQYTWNGSLDFYESETVVLPEISYQFAPENIVRASIVQANGTTDENVDNNTVDSDFDLAPITTQNLIVDIRSMTRPNRMSYVIINSLKDTVFSAGPFGRTEKSVKKTINLSNKECYEIIINNRAPGTSNGRVTVKDDASKIVFATRHIPYGRTKVHFTTDHFIKTNDPEANADKLDWELSPNPAGNLTIIKTMAHKPMQVHVSIQNLLGRTLEQSTYWLGRNNNEIRLDLSKFHNGIYMISVQQNHASAKTKKLLVRK